MVIVVLVAERYPFHGHTCIDPSFASHNDNQGDEDGFSPGRLVHSALLQTYGLLVHAISSLHRLLVILSAVFFAVTRCQLVSRPPVSYISARDGTLLAYRDYNNHDLNRSNQSTIVLSHGAWSNGDIFYKQFSDFALSAFRIIAYDQRGFGYSEKPTGPQNYTSNELLGDDLHSLITELGLEKPIISGWSAGATSVLDYLQANGDSQISGIHLIDPLACVSEACINATIASIELIPSFGDLTSPNETIQFAATRDWALTLAYNNTISPEDSLIVNSLAETVPPFVQISRYQIPFLNYNETLAVTGVPVLLQHGQDDTILFFQSDVPVIQALTSRLTSHKCPACGHIPYILQADAFNRDLASWINGI
ncbi:MAG: hypothetical protein TREMPRED_004299 [Tremellales sp. Tagirdzhanova-0007]|nr:MAG: hypothetical protein TREMPRED_004299 [Tremellales sp. Tagirdzhanova-0007]